MLALKIFVKIGPSVCRLMGFMLFIDCIVSRRIALLCKNPLQTNLLVLAIISFLLQSGVVLFAVPIPIDQLTNVKYEHKLVNSLVEYHDEKIFIDHV